MGHTEPSLIEGAPTPAPQQVLMQTTLGLWAAQAVATAARLGIADALAQSQPQESTTLACAVGADAAALARLLRALASIGVLAEPHPHQYALTPVGELLRSEVPGSMRDWLIAETDPAHWQAWGRLSEGVRSGQAVVPQVFGMPIYEYYAAHPEERACFSRAMGNVSALVARGTVQQYDFSHARHIVDVGGAHGDLLLAILDANPVARGTVFDRPHVADAARAADPREGIPGAVRGRGRGFLAGGAAGGGPLRAQVHFSRLAGRGGSAHSAPLPHRHHPGRHAARDRDDDPGRQSPVAGAAVRPAHAGNDRGQERTESEYRALMARAGFRLTRILPTGSPFHLLEAVAA